MRPITQEKLDSLTNFMQNNAIDAIFIVDSETNRDVNMRYLTGHPMDAMLIITDSGETCLIPWDMQLAQDHAKADEFFDFKATDMRWTDVRLAKSFITKSVKKEHPIFAVNQNIPYRFVNDIQKNYPDARIFDKPSEIREIFVKLRATKSEQELKYLREAAKIGNKTIADIKEFAQQKEGTETDLSFLVMKKIREYGAEGNSFPSLVANTDRSHMIHCHPMAGPNKFSKEGLALIDFGASYKGYASDITLPFAFGELDDEQYKIRELTIQAYEAAIESIDIGVPLWKISKAANDVIEDAGYKMPHSLGHGLGLAVHDAPSVRQKPTDPQDLEDWTEQVVENGMVFTIEPGVYVKGKGGQRLENDVMIRKGKVEVYTKSEPITI
ncbi:MAG: M24 family metallopeptidase [Asgard group archaeon]|nr:M24 family metallopeptidase [Asgard group archaeon]